MILQGQAGETDECVLVLGALGGPGALWVSGRPQAGFAKSWWEVALFLTGRGFSRGLRHHTLTLSRAGLQTAG